MTEVRYVNEGKQILFEVNGNAEYTSDGADIVCAACSVLSGTLATCIANMPVNANICFESGNLQIVIDKESLGTYMLEVKHALDFAMLGYKLLEEQYPSNVIITAW